MPHTPPTFFKEKIHTVGNFIDDLTPFSSGKNSHYFNASFAMQKLPKSHYFAIS